MKEKFKPINFNSKNIFVALFTTICLYILRVFMLAIFESSTQNDVLSEILVYIIFIIVLFIIEKKYLTSKAKTIFKDIKKNIVSIIFIPIILLIAEYIVNYFLIRITGENPAGQDMFHEFFKNSPILLSTYVILLSPILETILYYLPYKNIKNKLVAYIFSSVVFAMFHMIFTNSLIALWFLVPYTLMALAFGYGMYKTNNIYVSMIIHSINNIAAIVLLLI